MTISVTESDFQPNAAALPEAWQNRPWGALQSLTMHGRFKVRHLIVRPGRALGLQSHLHRSEHWVVVRGSARATINGQVRDIFENQSIDIPVGHLHSLENHGKVDLHLIEVQTGAYLGEDDIERFEPPKAMAV